MSPGPQDLQTTETPSCANANARIHFFGFCSRGEIRSFRIDVESGGNQGLVANRSLTERGTRSSRSVRA
jgi:hypothetical protein